MSHAPADVPNGDPTGLRAIAATVDRELTALPIEGTIEDRRQAKRGLLTAWARLVDVLALGPTVSLRECPSCGQRCMRAATRCGFCWNRLEPCPPEDPAGAH